MRGQVRPEVLVHDGGEQAKIDLEKIKAAGVQVLKTPEPVLQAQLAAWDKLIELRSGEDPFFAKVLESQKAWVKRVVGFYRDYNVSSELAYDHFVKA